MSHRHPAPRDPAPADSTPVDRLLVGGLWVHQSIPAVYQQAARERPHTVQCYRRVRGGWEGTSNARAAQHVQHIAQGLLDLGVARGDRVAILAATRPEWGLADMASLHLGAVTVGVYPTLPPEEVAYILEHSGASVLFLERREQLEALDAVRGGLPELKHVVLFEGSAAGAISLEALEARGRVVEGGPARFEAAWRRLGPDDLATIIYTSGTTGEPKGALLTHGNLTYVIEAGAQVLPHQPGDEGVVFLPMAHALMRVASYGGLLTGAAGYYNLDHARLMDDIREVAPTVQVSVPRIWEKLYARLQEAVAGLPPRRRRVFAWGLAVGREASALERRGEPLPLALRAQLALARRLVHDRLKGRVFGARIRFLTSGGAPIDVEVLEYFHALGLLILEGWGLTETAAPATLNRPGAFKFGTVGQPISGTEVRVAPDGELLVRGPGVFRGYYRNEEATAAAFTDDGYFRTGDIGEVDADGFVRITDRKKNIIVLSGGKNVAPQKLENHFQTIPLLAGALVHGDRRNYLTALFTLDPEEAVRWAVGRSLLGQEALAAAADPRAAAAHLPALLADPTLREHLEREVSRSGTATSSTASTPVEPGPFSGAPRRPRPRLRSRPTRPRAASLGAGRGR
jgi:long-chain acyl-CoA synthetase